MPLQDESAVTLTVLDHPFARLADADRRVLPTAWGKSLTDVLPTHVTPDGTWVVVEDGRVLAREAWQAHLVTPGAELICYPRIAGGPGVLQIIIGAVIFAIGATLMFIPGGQPFGVPLMMLGFSMMVGGAVTMIIGEPDMPVMPALSSGSQATSQTYNFQGIRNSTRLGAPIPVVYGTHKVGGQYVELYTTNDNDESSLYALIALSEGEITDISGIEINGQPITNYRDVTTDTRLGTNNQTAMSFFGDATTATYSSDAGISDVDWTTYTTAGTNLTAWEMLLSLPQGLYTVNVHGDLTTRAVTVNVEYKLTSAGSWTSLGSFTYTEAKRSNLFRTIRKDGLTAGQYDIRMQRTTPQATDIRTSDMIRRSAVNEIVNDAYLYPNVALLGIKALATDQLSGGTPTITSIVQGVKVRVYTDTVSSSTIYANNPAWIVFDMLTNTRYGSGKFYTPSNLDIQSFIDWAAFCDALVPDGRGGTEKRATCDYVFDADRTVIWDAVMKICGLGFAQPVKVGTSIRIKFQQAEAAAQLFTMANIVKDSFRETWLPLKERANYFEVQYLNASNNYEQDMVVLEDPLLFANSEPERKQTVSVFGVTRTSHAARLARFYQKANRYVTRTIEFEAGVDAIRCEPGDVIRFQHDVPGWGLLGIRAATGSGASTIIIDAPVTLAAATVYQVLVRHADDTVEIKTITSVAGTYAAGAALSIAADTWTSIPADGDVVAIGITGIATKPFRILSIERTQEMMVRVSGVEYSADLYDETTVGSVNQVQYSTLNALLGPVPAVTNLAILQLSSAKLSVWISFTPPSSLNYSTTRLYQTVNGIDVLLGTSRDGSFPIEGSTVGQLLTVKAVTLSVDGVVGSIDTAPTASAIVTESPPPDVTGFSWYFLGGHLRLFWTAVNWVRVVEYEIRIGTNWNNAITLGRTAYTTTDGNGNGTYWVAAYDPVTQSYSAVPVSLSNNIFRMTTGESLSDNIIQTRDEDALLWPGTVSSGAVVDAASNTVRLIGTGLWDDMPDMDLVSDIDFYGGVATSGSYEIPTAGIVDLGTAKTASVVATYLAKGDTTIPTWGAISDFDLEPDIDGNYNANVALELMINTDQGAGFTGWRKFVPGEQVFRKVKLRADLRSTDVGVTCILSDLNWTVDMPDRTEEQHDVALNAAGQAFPFSPAYQIVPNVQVTIQNAQTGDYTAVTLKTVSGFTLRIFDSGGTGVSRMIDWSAKGY